MIPTQSGVKPAITLAEATVLITAEFTLSVDATYVPSNVRARPMEPWSVF